MSLLQKILVPLTLACLSACMRAHTPLAVSPIGHGGPPSRKGPGPHGILWRAQGLAAPVSQECHPRADHHDLACAVPPRADAFAEALPHRAKHNEIVGEEPNTGPDAL